MTIIVHNEYLTYSKSADGIGYITIDQKNEPVNLFSFDFIRVFIQASLLALEETAVKGVIVTSGQKLFMAGGDLRFLCTIKEESADFFSGLMALHQGFRKIEMGGKPFVAAINGTALGGGFELCLCCHYRIALNEPTLKIGFPEINVGLFPGAGGTSRLPYLSGLQTALTYLLQGIEAKPDKALKDGLIHEIADSPEEMIEKARAFILNGKEATQPWDNKKHTIPNGGINSPSGYQIMMAATGNVRKLTHGNHPAATMILRTLHDGLDLPIDRALEIEARYFTYVCQTKEAKNMIKTGFFAIQAAKKGKDRPQGYPPFPVKTIGIIGAGMMGAGIAYVAAKAGIKVVLKDINHEAAEKGKNFSRKLLQKAISTGKSTEAKSHKLLENIQISEDYLALSDCDLVIETVIENPDIKAGVTAEMETVMGNHTIIGTNTSTIPISLLAQACKNQGSFIGIHFFSPVDKMHLVEIIRGKLTTDDTVAKAIDFVIAIGKIPIVVNDSRGFFASRCFSTYCSEGLFLLEEGAPAAMIENISRIKGMAVGPLAVMDEVSLGLIQHIYESNPEPKTSDEDRQYQIIQTLMTKHGRSGKKDGKGFYDYPLGEKKKLWGGLKNLFNANPEKISQETIAKRLMHRQALECYRCLEEGILAKPAEGDIGSVLGWGFPIYTGGAISYIDYIGKETFIADCDYFTAVYGQRFRVPDSLRIK